MNKSILLSVRNLTVVFGKRVAIRDLSFDLRGGHTLAVIGPNGAGRTVLLKALLNRVPYRENIVWAQGTGLAYVPQKIAADRQMRCLFATCSEGMMSSVRRHHLILTGHDR